LTGVAACFTLRGVDEREAFDRICTEVCAGNGWALEGRRIDVPLDGGRHQKVSIEDFAFEGAALVRLVSTIGNAARVEPLRLVGALRINFGLPHGALAIRGDDLVMVDTVQPGRTEASELEASVRYLAETADRFERTMFGPDAH
jgi:hypothetical protein